EQGIKHEISYAAVIRNNQVAHNGTAFDVWLWGAQILVQNSPNVEVTGNEVIVAAHAGDGIAVINQDRGDGAHGPWVSRNVSVYDNQVTYLGDAGASGVADDTGHRACDDDWNNRFDRNTYRVMGDQDNRFMFCTSGDFEHFRAQLQ